MEYELTVTIAAPLRRVWEILTDVERMPEWTASMTEVRRLDDGPLSVGRRTRILQPKMRPLVWTVTDLARERSFVWTATTGGMLLTGGHYLTAGDGDVSARFTMRLSGGPAFLLGPLVKPRTRRYVRMEAEGLKRRCEESGS